MTQVARKQTTLGAEGRLRGTGIHSGATATVALLPAPANTGIRFVSEGVTIPARAENVIDTSRCTCLGLGSARVATVEHLMSALFGLGVDNVSIHVDGPELPILDGSAIEWVNLLRESGIVVLDDPVSVRSLSAPISVRQGESSIVVEPAERFELTCITDYRHPLLGRQEETYTDLGEQYVRDLAQARTFGFVEEVEALRSSGMALGGSLDNALIVKPDRFSSDLRVPNECLRHKALDLIGDIALCGARFRGRVRAERPGHRLNTQLALQLSKHFDRPSRA